MTRQNFVAGRCPVELMPTTCTHNFSLIIENPQENGVDGLHPSGRFKIIPTYKRGGCFFATNSSTSFPSETGEVNSFLHPPKTSLLEIEAFIIIFGADVTLLGDDKIWNDFSPISLFTGSLLLMELFFTGSDDEKLYF